MNRGDWGKNDHHFWASIHAKPAPLSTNAEGCDWVLLPRKQKAIAMDGPIDLLTRGGSASLDDRVIALSRQLGLHRLRILWGRKGPNLHVIKLVMDGRVIDHEDGVALLA